MLTQLLELYRSLTNPERLVDLLNGALAGWAAYLALFAVVFSETGLLIGFFLPETRFSSPSAWWPAWARSTFSRSI